MTCITIRKEWFEDIKNTVAYNDPYFYFENGTEYVEVDVDETAFNAVSTELGWM